MVGTKKKTVLITGCSEGGLGDALAQEYHRKGLRVFATARNLARVQHLKAQGIEILPLDVSDAESLEKVVAALKILTGGTLDILVNNAGSGYQAPLMDVDIDDAKKTFDINVWGLLRATQAFVPFLAKARGRIVNIGSIASAMSVPWAGVYNASKGAVHMLSDTMAVELAPFGIHVIHVFAGTARSKFYANAAGYHLPADSIYEPAREEVEAALNADIPKAGQATYPAEKFASRVVANSLSSWPSKMPAIGGSSSVVSLGAKFIPQGLLEQLYIYIFGINAITRKLAATGATT